MHVDYTFKLQLVHEEQWKKNISVYTMTEYKPSSCVHQYLFIDHNTVVLFV